jgi:ABC-type branched-subunit amino acid transport system substrate-binding protein
MNTSAVADPFGTEAWNAAAYAYDCVIAFAIAFSRSTDFQNGAEVTARFREARFDGATGQVQFDLQGDRDPTTIHCTSLAEDLTRRML